MAAAAPGKRQIHEREPAGPERQAHGRALGDVPGSKAVARDLSLLEHHERAKRPPDRVLDALLQDDAVGRAKPVIVVARQETLAVDVGAPEGRLKEKGHALIVAGLRAIQKNAKTDRARTIARPLDGRT